MDESPAHARAWSIPHNHPDPTHKRTHAQPCAPGADRASSAGKNEYMWRTRYRSNPCARVCPGSPQCLFTGRGERSTPGLRLFLRLLSRSRFSCGCVVGFEWMVVRFVRVIRVPACARVSRVSRVAFVCCCFACDCVLELVVCRVRFARVSCPRVEIWRVCPGLPPMSFYRHR